MRRSTDCLATRRPSAVRPEGVQAAGTPSHRPNSGARSTETAAGSPLAVPVGQARVAEVDRGARDTDGRDAETRGQGVGCRVGRRVCEGARGG
ncbi:hypothetical protein GCM10027028_12080 [Streptomyces sundarbansensis]